MRPGCKAPDIEEPGLYSLGFDILSKSLADEALPESVSFLPSEAYDSYLRMHKVVVGSHGANRLEEIYDDLEDESLPDYLSAAGWAAAEVAIARTQEPAGVRLEFLERAKGLWERAVDHQRLINASGIECMTEWAFPHRIALDIATQSLVAGAIEGSLDQSTLRSVFEDCLNIAQKNAVALNLASREGHTEAMGEHIGLGYELNALLAFNRRFDENWFVMPSLGRSDTGYHHPGQTHDLLVVHHEDGQIVSMTPVEIKASASNRDRKRFKALLVRGKMHLSMPGNFRPEQTLEAIEADYEGRASEGEQEIADGVTGRFVEMVRDYQAGARLARLATQKSVTVFRNKEQVLVNHPGLVSVPA